MFLRIFRYRVKPQMRDRHLAVQARAARLYEQHVRHAPRYFRRSGDPNSWVELHWYDDKEECQRVAAAVADDGELARLWRDFQETLDGDYPPTLEEFGEYELPRPVNASPFAQPPIDAASGAPHGPPPAASAAKAGADDPPVSAAHAAQHQRGAKPSDEVHGSAGRPADNGDAKRREQASDDEPGQSAETVEDKSRDDDLVIEDDGPIEPRQSNSLSFNDGVWIVEPEEKPPYPRSNDH